MTGYDLLKRINEFMRNLYSINAEIQTLIKDKEYLQDIKKGIAILKVSGRISADNIDNIMNELSQEYGNKYNTNYKYYGDYIKTIDVIISDIEKLIDRNIQDKLNDVATKKLLEEALGKNE